ncbi:MAG: hydroxyacid dehydrogenase [Roseiflexaceae bacterium]|nr:hydroxyacid dehydrogenase [Roseiflexaceae bacterium]
MTILLLETIHEQAHGMLADHDHTVLADSADDLEQTVQREQVVAILTRGRGRISAALMARCPGLRVVARCGVGLDNIDVQAAHERGIAVIYAPGSTTAAVAEHTLMLMLAAARKLHPIATAVSDNDWAARDTYRGIELTGKSIGIVGLGAAGRRVAELAQAFGMQVLTWSRTSRDSRYESVSLDTLLERADVVTLHAALTPATRHLIGVRELALMKPQALLINTARGGLIDQRALGDALERGAIGGFAADVLDPEPPAASERLLRNPSVLVTPHIAALTDVTYRAMCVRTAANVLAVLRGDQPERESVYNA